jgi:outer membrane protein TolC
MRYKLLKILTLCLAVVGASCSTTWYKEKADEEVYGIIAEKTPEVVGMPATFTIEPDEINRLEGISIAGPAPTYLGEEGKSEEGALVISLEKALELSVWTSRDYQNAKEQLYLQFLGLTLDRYQFTPIFTASGSVDYARSTTDILKTTDGVRLAQVVPDWMRQTATLTGIGLSQQTTAANLLQTLQNNGVAVSPQLIGGLQTGGQLASTPGDLMNVYANLVESAFTQAGLNQPRAEIMDERSVDGQTFFGVNMLLKGGGQIAASLTSNFLRFLTGDARVTTSSLLTATITQPLMRGRGSRVAAEFLTQAERDALYELRSFTRFRKTFAVQVASNYYQVLQARDTANNSFRAYESFQYSAELERALAVEGRRTLSDLGVTEQGLLNSETSWVNSVRAYSSALDQFKILLGLPTDAKVILDEGELEQLEKRGPVEFPVSAEDAIIVALASRLDYYTARDQRDDTIRRIYVAANNLKMDLDLVLTGAVNSKPGADEFDTLDFDRAQWTAGFDVDLPLSRKPERNAYVASLIVNQRAERDLLLSQDLIKFEVRNAWRELDQARKNYDTAQSQIELNRRRVEDEELKQELGRSTARDLVEAIDGLTEAENDSTDALVTHTVSRLEFWRDMGILYIKESGEWEDISDLDFLQLREADTTENPSSLTD